MELKTLREEVDKKLAELEQRRTELAQMLTEKDEAETRKAKELGKMYEKMNPIKAAEVIASLEKDLAVSILEGMRAKSAGKILAGMERETAADLTVSYSSLAE
jgi:flagellar motility protein MotE (MotC chaperone)